MRLGGTAVHVSGLARSVEQVALLIIDSISEIIRGAAMQLGVVQVLPLAALSATATRNIRIHALPVGGGAAVAGMITGLHLGRCL